MCSVSQRTPCSSCVEQEFLYQQRVGVIVLDEQHRGGAGRRLRVRRGLPGVVSHHLTLFVIFVNIIPVQHVGLGQHSWPDTAEPSNAGCFLCLSAGRFPGGRHRRSAAAAWDACLAIPRQLHPREMHVHRRPAAVRHRVAPRPRHCAMEQVQATACAEPKPV
jgi:hypothetical protein